METNSKKELLGKMRSAKEIYILMSNCTRMPYVACDAETYDDEIFLFFTEEEAKNEAKKMLEEKEPVQVLKVENQSFLSFYSSLYAIGVNCIVVNKGSDEETHIQLSELVQKATEAQLPEGHVRIENPEFHLTTLYFMQAMRKQQEPTMSEEMKELHEEMMNHFREGKYIIAVRDGKEMPALRQKDGKVFQPLFTDVFEFQKFKNFNKEDEIKAGVVEADKIPQMLSKESSGVTVNPFGVNLQLQMNVPKKDA